MKTPAASSPASNLAATPEWADACVKAAIGQTAPKAPRLAAKVARWNAAAPKAQAAAEARSTPTAYRLTVTHQTSGDIDLVDTSSGVGQMLASFGNCLDPLSARLAIARDIADAYNAHAGLVARVAELEAAHAVACKNTLATRSENAGLRAALELLAARLQNIEGELAANLRGPGPQFTHGVGIYAAAEALRDVGGLAKNARAALAAKGRAE